MVDRSLSALGNRQPLVGPGQAGQDREAGRIRRRFAERAEGVRVHVPDGFLGRVPQAVGMRQLHAVGIRKQGRVGRPGHAVQLVGDVVVLVPDDQVRIAALAGVVAAAIGVRPVLVIAFDDGPCRDRNRHDVALAGIVVDDDVDLRRAVAVNDVDRNPVQRTVAVGGTIRPQSGWMRIERRCGQ